MTSQAMSLYEKKQWAALEAHWKKKANRKKLVPTPVRRAAATAVQRTIQGAQRAGRFVSDHTPEVVKERLDEAGDKFLEPVIESAAHIIELVNDWVIELTDPEKVIAFHRDRGRPVETIEDIRNLDLKDADEMVRGMTLKWRSLGGVEGAGLSALALIPVAGGFFAISLDILLMQMLTTAIATRVCFAYGMDPRDPSVEEVLKRMVGRTFAKQVPKAGIARDVNYARQALKDRVKWSEKLRNDHRIVAQLEKLMKTWNKGNFVPVRQVAKAVPWVSLITATGTNAWVMGDVAKQSCLYGQTLFLAEKYGLELPANLATLADDGDANDDTEGPVDVSDPREPDPDSGGSEQEPAIEVEQQEQDPDPDDPPSL